MDRSAYYQQIRFALAHARRKLVAYGIALAPVNLSIIIAGFIVFQWYPEWSLTYFAIAGPVCVAAQAATATLDSGSHSMRQDSQTSWRLYGITT